MICSRKRWCALRKSAICALDVLERSCNWVSSLLDKRKCKWKCVENKWVSSRRTYSAASHDQWWIADALRRCWRGLSMNLLGGRKRRHKQGLKRTNPSLLPHLHSSFSCWCSCSFCICLGGSFAGDLRRSVELLRMLRVSAGIGDNSVALLTCPMGAALAALSGALQKPRRSSSSASARCVFCA